jgi:hypothetical protein
VYITFQTDQKQIRCIIIRMKIPKTPGSRTPLMFIGRSSSIIHIHRCEVVFSNLSKSKMNRWWQSQMMANDLDRPAPPQVLHPHSIYGRVGLTCMSFCFQTIHRYNNILRIHMVYNFGSDTQHLEQSKPLTDYNGK